MMTRLPYGRREIELSLPAGIVLSRLVPSLGRALPDPDGEVRRSLREPMGLPPLREWVRPGERVAVVTSDATRPAMQGHYLPHILAELGAAGLGREAVTLVIGLGTHRPPTEAEVGWLLGEAAHAHPVAWPNCDDEASLVHLGVTGRGTPVRIFRTVAEADRVILTGSINHHAFAGFSAGPKSLLPGVASRDSIQANHALTLNASPPGGMNPACRAGRLDGNPVAEDIADALRLFPPPVFLVNVVPAPEGGLLQAVAGEPLAAHRAGCLTADGCYTVAPPERRRLVLASCGGYPSDINLYQSTKGIVNLCEALADGGVGVLLAECGDGLGSDGFLEWLRLGRPEAIEARLRRDYTVPGWVAHYITSATRRAHLIVVSTLDTEVVREFGLIPAESLEEALGLGMEILGGSPPGYLMPKASMTVPRVPSSSRTE